MGVMIRHEIEVDLGELSEQLSDSEKWALIDMLLEDVKKVSSKADWDSFFEDWGEKSMKAREATDDD